MNVMNVTTTVTKYMETKQFDSQRNVLGRDGTRMSMNTLLIITFRLITHISKSGRTAIANNFTETVQKLLEACGALPDASTAFLKLSLNTFAEARI